MRDDAMVERVAMAIWQGSVGSARWHEWDEFVPNAWGRIKSLAQARAAIQAMREPTHLMENRGIERLDEVTGENNVQRGHLNEAWRAMVDAAVSP